jgi:hypothetical protein
VVRAIEYVERISRENSQLQGKLDSYQKRIDELEVLIRKFREDQGRIEEGILSALDRLNKFEDAIEKSIAPALLPQASKAPPRRENTAQKKGAPPPPQAPAPMPAAVPTVATASADSPIDVTVDTGADGGEIEKLEPEDDREEPEENPFEDEASQDGPASGELDIF